MNHRAAEATAEPVEVQFSSIRIEGAALSAMWYGNHHPRNNGDLPHQHFHKRPVPTGTADANTHHDPKRPRFLPELSPPPPGPPPPPPSWELPPPHHPSCRSATTSTATTTTATLKDGFDLDDNRQRRIERSFPESSCEGSQRTAESVAAPASSSKSQWTASRSGSASTSSEEESLRDVQAPPSRHSSRWLFQSHNGDHPGGGSSSLSISSTLTNYAETNASDNDNDGDDYYDGGDIEPSQPRSDTAASLTFRIADATATTGAAQPLDALDTLTDRVQSWSLTRLRDEFCGDPRPQQQREQRRAAQRRVRRALLRTPPDGTSRHSSSAASLSVSSSLSCQTASSHSAGSSNSAVMED